MEQYFTVLIPFAPADRATQWHPTENTGPFAWLTRGAFDTMEDAHKWAADHLDGNPYIAIKVRY